MADIRELNRTRSILEAKSRDPYATPYELEQIRSELEQVNKLLPARPPRRDGKRDHRPTF